MACRRAGAVPKASASPRSTASVASLSRRTCHMCSRLPSRTSCCDRWTRLRARWSRTLPTGAAPAPSKRCRSSCMKARQAYLEIHQLATPTLIVTYRPLFWLITAPEPRLCRRPRRTSPSILSSTVLSVTGSGQCPRISTKWIIRRGVFPSCRSIRR